MFRFTIRDVLWLTAVAAFAVLWGMERQQRAVETARGRAKIERLQDELDTALSHRLSLMPMRDKDSRVRFREFESSVEPSP